MWGVSHGCAALDLKQALNCRIYQVSAQIRPLQEEPRQVNVWFLSLHVWLERRAFELAAGINTCKDVRLLESEC